MKCNCGCGRETKISLRRDKRHGYEKGEPRKYVKGHQPKHNCKSEVDFLVEDHGYKTHCWVWKKAVDKDGYGQKKVNGRATKAHRHYYEKTFGSIPADRVLDHLCRVRACVNPEHGEPITGTENTRRGMNTKINIETAARIRQLAKEGLFQRQIAEMVGIGRSQVNSIVRGKAWL